MDISSGCRTTTNNEYQQRFYKDYQQWHICSSSKTTTDDSFKTLQMIFSVVMFLKVDPLIDVVPTGHHTVLPH
jgi:hypothetical protein